MADKLPLPPADEFIGNGDPNFYLTAGVPDGQQVPVTPSVGKDETTHPLYAAYLEDEK